MMDKVDQRILSLLGQDARMSVAVMARKLGMARSTLQTRIERMERDDVIAGYTVRLGDAAARGRLRATILLTLEPRAQPAVLARLKATPEVQSAHTTSGRFDLMVHVAADTASALDKVLDIIGETDGVKSSESLIHLSTRIDRTV
ncbi:AsnC family transcriptional regulator [Rhodovulum imhoffii]|uniref:AsnC family transcriptional regulator n=2 Tax=Rhodovulum imhoffii TaxID=365340 RepID=A0A2T5BWA4_9RHOB|nr:AsnC family transcriptional regulator [Rhodovulum imhoffii]